MSAMMDAFYLCLAASLIWAPIVFAGAFYMNSRAGRAAEATIWPTALFIAALPALSAPLAAILGLSLRQPAPLPPMSEPVMVVSEVAAPAATVAPNATIIDVGVILNAVADLYFYGFILFAALGLLRLVGFSYRVRYSYEIDDAQLVDGLKEWRSRMRVRQPVRFAYSDAVSSVCVHGFLRPVVLMPPQLLERVTTEDAILMGAHEMAHIKRGDTWLFAFCGFAKAMFWFNPFMRRIVAHAQLAAEQSADALVIQRGVNRQSYARCFVESLKVTSGLSSPQYALVPSFTPFDKRSRRDRLDAILSGRGASLSLGAGPKLTMILSGAAAIILAFGQAALAVSPPPAKDALTHIPVEGKITFGFEEKSKVLDKDRPHHEGLDIAAERGTPIVAAGDGKVIDATARYNNTTDWGKVVVIDHGHGLVTRYAHMDSYIVRKGESVKGGDTIGAVGSTGRSTGPHLHFEILNDGVHIDPSVLVSAPEAPAPVKATRKVQMAPLAPQRLATTIAPAPYTSSTRKIITPAPRLVQPVPITIRANPAPKVFPAPVIEAEPAIAPAPTPELSLGQRLEHRLAGKFGEWSAHVDANLKGLEDMTVRFGKVEFEGLENAEDIAEALSEAGFVLEDLDVVMEDFPRLAFNFDGRELTEEERAEIEEARREAMEDLKEARKEAMEDAREARKEAMLEMRERQKEIEHARREMERSQRAVQLDVERTKRDRERAIHDSEHAHDHEIDEAEILRLREEALREAEASLARERKELERLRKELKAKKKRKN